MGTFLLCFVLGAFVFSYAFGGLANGLMVGLGVLYFHLGFFLLPDSVKRSFKQTTSEEPVDYTACMAIALFCFVPGIFVFSHALNGLANGLMFGLAVLCFNLSLLFLPDSMQSFVNSPRPSAFSAMDGASKSLRLLDFLSAVGPKLSIF